MRQALSGLAVYELRELHEVSTLKAYRTRMELHFRRLWQAIKNAFAGEHRPTRRRTLPLAALPLIGAHRMIAVPVVIIANQAGTEVPVKPADETAA